MCYSQCFKTVFVEIRASSIQTYKATIYGVSFCHIDAKVAIATDYCKPVVTFQK